MVFFLLAIDMTGFQDKQWQIFKILICIGRDHIKATNVEECYGLQREQHAYL